MPNNHTKYTNTLHKISSLELNPEDLAGPIKDHHSYWTSEASKTATTQSTQEKTTKLLKDLKACYFPDNQQHQELLIKIQEGGYIYEYLKTQVAKEPSKASRTMLALIDLFNSLSKLDYKDQEDRLYQVLMINENQNCLDGFSDHIENSTNLIKCHPADKPVIEAMQSLYGKYTSQYVRFPMVGNQRHLPAAFKYILSADKPLLDQNYRSAIDGTLPLSDMAMLLQSYPEELKDKSNEDKVEERARYLKIFQQITGPDFDYNDQEEAKKYDKFFEDIKPFFKKVFGTEEASFLSKYYLETEGGVIIWNKKLIKTDLDTALNINTEETKIFITKEDLYSDHLATKITDAICSDKPDNQNNKYQAIRVLHCLVEGFAAPDYNNLARALFLIGFQGKVLSQEEIDKLSAQDILQAFNKKLEAILKEDGLLSII